MASPLPKNVTTLHKPASSIVMVTPEMATRWLERNKANRPLRLHKVDQYARDMQGGKWELTGTIEFDTNGDLIQGQHRLSAVVKSGCTVGMFVLRGISPDAQRVMDSGIARTAADNLHMDKGIKNAVAVASIARQRVSAELNCATKAVSNSEIAEYVERHPDISFAASIAVKYSRGCDIAPTTVGLAAWMIADVHGWAVAEEFFYTAAEKVGLKRHDPVMAMAKFFAEARRSRKQYPLDIQLSVIIRAFNCRRAGKAMQFMRTEVNGNAVPIPPVAH